MSATFLSLALLDQVWRPSLLAWQVGQARRKLASHMYDATGRLIERLNVRGDLPSNTKKPRRRRFRTTYIASKYLCVNTALAIETRSAPNVTPRGSEMETPIH